jgi:LCP family protein required for cell wall assembly
MKTFTSLHRLRRQLLSHPRLIRWSLLILVILISLTWASRFTSQLQINLSSLGNIWQQAQSAISSQTQLNHYQGRINAILLGISSPAHEGSQLTDSIMFLSFNMETSQLVVLPIPRDIWVPSLKNKINTAYTIGELRQPRGGGIVLAKAAVSEIVDQPIHYAAVVNFQGFVEGVDLLGGLEVDVQRGFTDNRYPVSGKETVEPESERYETVTFASGLQHMNGQTALKFTRSRYAEGPEGTDLARSERQKQVLKGLKAKLISTNLIFNPDKIAEIKDTYRQYIHTDVVPELYPAIAQLALKHRTLTIHSAAIPIYLPEDKGNASENQALLISPTDSLAYDGQWVLAPVDHDFIAIHKYIRCVLDKPEEQEGCVKQ